MRNLLSKAAKYRAEARRRKLWQRVVSLLVCVVVFVTTYAQILPAIALEADLFEPDGHVHTDECYKIVKTEEKTELDCPLELHTHTAACYDADGALACGYADFVVHTHDSNCYDENGKLVCTLPEIEEHTHTALCYPVRVDGPADGTDSTGVAHVHTDECYTETPSALLCGEEETDGHTHTEDCYVETEQLVCELEESEGHTHTDLCMDTEGLPELCGLEESEGHTHDESCYETVRELVCEQEEAEPHTHTEDCYASAEKELTCGFEESESEEKSEGTEETPDFFAGEDKDPQPICGQEEIELHTHTAACFGAGGAVVCGQLEVLEHQHTEDCLRVVQEASEEKVLDCAYTGSADKADEERPADSSTAGKDEEKPADSGATGGEDGGKEDGTTAPSDPDDEPVLTPATLAERVLAAAESYIGYKEDAEDCDIDADGETRGLTQFGLHYGMPYEKWDAMFVAYCLEEAGVEELPSAADCLFDIDVWASMLDGAGYCQTAELYTPAPGDVAFFDLDGDGTLDHVAFVEKVTDARLFVIAGDSNDCVRRASYARADESVVGYGVLPRDEDEPQDSPADEPDEDEGAADDGLTGGPSEDETEDDPAASDPMDGPQDDGDNKTGKDDPDKAGEGDKTDEEDKKDEDADQDSTQEAALGLAGRVLAAAQAEFGYTSAPDGTTLYRTFYDDPTAPLDVLFVAYCLDQAGIEGVPSAQDSGFDSEQWRAALAEAGMFRAAGAEEAAPAPGEVLFLDKDGDGAADFVAIVEKVAGGKVHVLEMAEAPAVAVAALALDTDEENGGETTASAAASCVRRVAYSLTDTQVLGYTALASLEDEDTALTEEEQAQVDEVIALIDALPTQKEIEEKLTAFEDAEDEDGYDAYLVEVIAQVKEAHGAYEALTEAQKLKVTNAANLMALEPLWSAQTLASNPLTEDVAYIKELNMGTNDQDSSGGITDGSAPWDSSDGDGLDTTANNKRVRTFDTVKYDFYYATGLQDTSSTAHYDSARVYFEFLLPAEQSQAVFSVDEMAWLRADGVSYAYEKEPVTIGNVSYQVLHGSFLDDREGSDITAASRSRDVMIRVLNMKNNSTIQPVFSVWMEYNDVGLTYENNIPAGIAYGNGHTCAAHRKNEVASLTPDAVTVTCTPRYAVTLKRGEAATSSWAGSFDFSTGNAVALDKANETWNGRISGYGIRLMVQGLDKEHGLRGCEFPEPGDTLEFDITLTTAWQNSNGGDRQYITREFTPKVWSAEEFSDAGTQKDGREVGDAKLPKYAAPLNKGENPAASCADGGTWAFTDHGYLSSDSNHRVIHVTVSGCTFDPEHLPHASYAGVISMDSGEFYNPEEVGNQWWNIQNAVFSTGEMWVVTPFYSEPGTDSDKYITNVMNTSSLTMWQSIFAYNMEVKDENSQTTYKKTGQLDQLDTSVTLQNPGKFNAQVFAVKPVNNWQEPLTDGCFQGENELKDYATPGSYVDLGALILHDGAEGDAVGVAYNVMIKFDNACFEPVTWAESSAGNQGNLNMGEFPYAGHTWYPWPEYSSSSDYQSGWSAHGPKMLYGTTKDGNGWNHNGQKPDGEGYDTEMMKATPDDLVWYDSMEDLKAAGAQCVAVLMEYRNVGNDGVGNPGKSTMNHLHMAVHARIKDTVEPGYVYAVSNYATVWTKADVQSYVTDVTGDGQIGTMDYLFYTQHDFPSYSPTAANKMDSASFPAPTHERSWDRCTNHGDGESGWDAVNGANGYGTARKSYVDANGTFIAGSGGYYFQDNVYVVSYKSQVGIQVAQTDGDGIARSTYSMDANQRVADFMVTPRFVRSATDTGGGGTTTTIYTDATLTVTLPQGLEYIPGTAFWGGEYTQDSACKAPGTVTGGQGQKTQVVKNADGTTTLTWVLEHVPLSKATEDLEPIYFSCQIGDSSDLANDVTNGQVLNVQTDIYSTADPGAVHGPAYNNQANTSILISKSTALTIIKTADKPIVDIGESMGFTMQIYNSSDSSYEGWVADVLPYKGVGRTSFHGTLQIEEFKIIGEVDPQWGDLTFYYTTDPQYNNLQDVTGLDISGWSTFQLDDEYTWTPAAQEQQITAIAYKCNIPGKGRIQMHITLSLPDSQPNDVIHNHLLLNSLISNDSSQIVSRTLEGLTWLDDNADGMQNEAAERRISGVKVTLLKLKDGGDPANESDYEPYHYQGDSTKGIVQIKTDRIVSVRAESSTAATDYELGRYKFTDLPAGTFAVRFEDGSTQINGLIASPSNRGTDDTQDSDGIATYAADRSTLEKTVILGIELPKAENMSVTLYESKYHDSGFYEKGHELPMTGGPGATPYTIGGLVAAIGAGLLLLYKDKRRRKKESASS